MSSTTTRGLATTATTTAEPERAQPAHIPGDFQARRGAGVPAPLTFASRRA